MPAVDPARRPRLVHLTTTDMSLDWLLGPQLVAFQAAGYEVIGMSAAGPHVDAIVDRGLRHVALDHATRAMAPTEDLKAFGELVRQFRSLRPDIVHTHNPKPGFYGRLAARVARVPVVVNTVHGLYALPEDRLIKRALVYSLERLAATCSQAELVQNPEDLDTMRTWHIPERRLRLLGNGVDLTHFDPLGVPDGRAAAVRKSLGVSGSDVVVGVVGRLVWEKGLREVFEAAGRLRATHPAVRVVVIGPNDLDKDDAVTAADVARAESDGVLFAGRRDDMVDVYAALDLFVLASYREGFPRSAMEAAAMAVPVIATDVRGCRQVVDHERTGLLVEVGDAAALTDAIGRLAVDAALRQHYGSAARDKAERDFDQQRVIDRTLATYEELLAAAHG